MDVATKKRDGRLGRGYVTACVLMCLVPVATFVSAFVSVILFPEPWCYASLQVLGAALLLLGCLFAYRKSGCGIGHSTDISCAFLGGACMFCYFPGALLVNLCAGALFPAKAVTESAQAGGSMLSFGFMGSWLLLAFLPAVTEELLCRGVLFTALRRYGVAFASLLSALCFAAMHGSVQQACYAFYFGLVLAALREASNSVVPGMVCHGLFNTVGVLQAALPGYFAGSGAVNGIFGTYAGLALLSVIGAFLGALVLRSCDRLSWHGDVRKKEAPGAWGVVLPLLAFGCNAAANMVIGML